MSGKRGNGSGSVFKRRANGPYIVAWYDHAGKRRIVNTRTTDQATARRYLAKQIDHTAQRKLGLVDARAEGFVENGKQPIGEHVEAYLAHCRTVGQNERAVYQKGFHLRKLVEDEGIVALSNLSAQALTSHIQRLKEAGKSARTCNFARQIAVAFMNWNKRYGRIENNPLTVVPKLDEQ